MGGCASPPSFKTVFQDSSKLPSIKDRIFVIVHPSNMGDLRSAEITALLNALESQLTISFKQAGLNANIIFNGYSPTILASSQAQAGGNRDQLTCNQSNTGNCLILSIAKFTSTVNRFGMTIDAADGFLGWRAKLFQVSKTSTGNTTTIRVSSAWTAESGLISFSDTQFMLDKYVGSARSLSNELIRHMQASGLIGKN
jgi:hypothetical protein